jgi:hypothetical protein
MNIENTKIQDKYIKNISIKDIMTKDMTNIETLKT